MKFYNPAVFLLAIAQSVVRTTTVVNTEPPACGELCIHQSNLASACSPFNTTCICANANLNAEIELCVAANCTIKEQLITKKYSYNTCGVVGENRSALVWVVGVAFGVLGLASFILRCYARLYIVKDAWGMDDWVMCLATCFMIPLSVISIPLSQHGLGLDVWNVSFDDITLILYLYFWDEILYVTALSLTKISIIFFYLRIFPKRSFRYYGYVLITLNFVYALAFNLALIFQCWPIEKAWSSWDGTHAAKCSSINALGWTAAAVNIGLDLATIALPLPELFRLSMSPKKKIQVFSMFSVGFLVTIISILRLRSLIKFGTTRNVTQNYVEVGYWSTIEVPVGVVCACMPAIRSMLSSIFPLIFDTIQRSKMAESFNCGRSSKPSSTVPPQIIVKKEWTVESKPERVFQPDLYTF